MCGRNDNVGDREEYRARYGRRHDDEANREWEPRRAESGETQRFDRQQVAEQRAEVGFDGDGMGYGGPAARSNSYGRQASYDRSGYGRHSHGGFGYGGPDWRSARHGHGGSGFPFMGMFFIWPLFAIMGLLFFSGIFAVGAFAVHSAFAVLHFAWPLLLVAAFVMLGRRRGYRRW